MTNDFSMRATQVRFRSIFTTVLLAVSLLLAVAVSPASAASFKYLFSPVNYPDGTTGTISAGVKPSKTSTFTFCYFETQDRSKVLGEYDSYANTATDPATVRDFCLSHYGDRIAS